MRVGSFLNPDYIPNVEGPDAVLTMLKYLERKLSGRKIKLNRTLMNQVDILFYSIKKCFLGMQSISILSGRLYIILSHCNNPSSTTLSLPVQVSLGEEAVELRVLDEDEDGFRKLSLKH